MEVIKEVFFLTGTIMLVSLIILIIFRAHKLDNFIQRLVTGIASTLLFSYLIVAGKVGPFIKDFVELYDVSYGWIFFFGVCVAILCHICVDNLFSFLGIYIDYEYEEEKEEDELELKNLGDVTKVSEIRPNSKPKER